MRHLTVHGHFYQPPREDPFTGEIPREYGAQPFDNWNERISAECYRPLAELGLFTQISFNVGPTLAMWMQQHAADVYAAMLDADRQNVARYGVGNAIAQVYNHVLMPLASLQDKQTQVTWGLADFQHRFGRKAEGMWLAETAVDIETLEVLADAGVKFTILAPWQVRNSAVDTSEPHVVHLPSRRTISVFFFHDGLSRNLQNNPLLTEDAARFADICLPLAATWDKFKRDEDQLVTIASDGEYYGHHLPGRDQFLRDLLRKEAPERGWRVTYPALYLREHPIMTSVEIAPNTAWSCYHGVDRWHNACNCFPGQGEWKQPFRRALDTAAAAIDAYYEVEGGELLRNHIAARNDYIRVKLGEVEQAEFIRLHASHPLNAQDTQRAAWLLEAQYYRQLMFTSCAFFFDEFARIEPKNAIAYTARALSYTRLATGVDLQEQFKAQLRKIRGQASTMSGEQIYRYMVMKEAVERIRD